jgi:hypothetical protein
MTDGQGISVSTDLVWDENPTMTHNQINQLFSQYLGIGTYHVIPDVNNEYIKHIDCWGKYLSPDTILIRQVPLSHSQYDEIEAAVDYFENQLSCYETPYNVVRVYTPNNEPYTNSLILNDKVLVPITGSIWDDDAIQSYQNAMPGYEVLGFSGSWASTDALHCRAIGIPDRKMLYIDHTPITNQLPSTNGFYIEAKVIAYSDANLLPYYPKIFWKNSTGIWNNITMTNIEGDIYGGYIPSHQSGERIYYYINAQDASGRNEDHPYIGASNPHSFSIVASNYTSLTFKPGWNLITIPIDNNWMASSLAGNITGCQMISWFDSQNQTYRTYILGIPESDFDIKDGYGLFVLTNQGSIFSCTGSRIVIVFVSLSIGWNMIGWYHDYNTSASSLAGNISGCQMVSWFDPINQTFRTYIVGIPESNFVIKQGMGLFIYVNVASTWWGLG